MREHRFGGWRTLNGPLAISGLAIAALSLAALVGLAFVGFIVSSAIKRRPEPKPDIPPAMRPGPPDETLERKMTQRHMGWSMLFVLFFAIWLPVVWLREPDTNVADEIEGVSRSSERGERWFAISDEENPTGFGCARCHGAEAEGGTTSFTPADGETIPEYPVPPLNNVCARLPIETVEVDGQVRTGIRDTIMQGREGTPMPSWSIRFEGPMNDQQIQDLINYIVAIQDVPPEENLCLDPTILNEPSESPSAAPTPAGGTTAGGAQTSPTPPSEPTQPSPAEAA